MRRRPTRKPARCALASVVIFGPRLEARTGPYHGQCGVPHDFSGHNDVRMPIVLRPFANELDIPKENHCIFPKCIVCVETQGDPIN